jgi:hypothetical protein
MGLGWGSHAVENPSSFDVNEEWIAGRVSALDMNRRQEFVRLRGYPSVDKVVQALPDLGWFAEWGKWVIPIRTIDGECYHVKAWTHNPGTKPDGTLREKWTTIGMGKAQGMRKQGKPIGQVFDLAWIASHYHLQHDGSLPWIWMTAGEFDCLMLRCNGWAATCTTTGESSSLSVEFFIREFGGLAGASEYLSLFSGIVLCYDCDPAGARGMQRHAALLDQFFEEINKASLDDKSGVHALPATFIGAKAVDLRAHPAWELLGSPSGWDVSDYARWAKANLEPGEASKWLRAQVAGNAAGVVAISGMLGLEYDESSGAPSIGEILIAEQFKTMSFEELIRAGINYTKGPGHDSRNHGWYHMAVLAARNGWTMEELWYQQTEDPTDGLGRMVLKDRLRLISHREWPGKPDMPESELQRTFERAFLNYKQSAFIMDDTANMLRLFHYFRWLRYHHTRGWMWFDNKAWIPGQLRAVECATQIGGLIMEEANNLAATDGPPKLIAALRRWAKQARMSGKIFSMLNLAAKHPLGRPDGDVGNVGGWDENPWYIGTSAGVFDLLNGKLLGKNESLNAYCSMTTPGTIDERGWDDGSGGGILNLASGAENGLGDNARLWDRVVRSWFDTPAEIDMLQEIGAVCLIGRLIQKLYVFESSGRSGKSLCLSAWAAALGEYSGVMLGSVMGSKSTDNAKTSAMAGIDALRMVRIDEMGSIAIDVEMLKAVTGETTMAARALRENWTRIRNEGTYIGTSNGSLNLSRDMTEALRSRIVYIKWPMTFVDANLYGRADYRGAGANDPHIKHEDTSLGWALTQPGMSSAVLTWMYAGLVRMLQRDGMSGLGVRVTESVMEAVEMLYAENNLVRQYFESSGFWRPVRDGSVAESAADKADARTGSCGTIVRTEGLRQRMTEWARTAGEHEFAAQLERGTRVLSAMLQKQPRGFTPMKNIGDALWQGPDRQCRAWQVPYVFIAVE